MIFWEICGWEIAAIAEMPEVISNKPPKKEVANIGSICKKENKGFNRKEKMESR